MKWETGSHKEITRGVSPERQFSPAWILFLIPITMIQYRTFRLFLKMKCVMSIYSKGNTEKLEARVDTFDARRFWEKMIGNTRSHLVVKVEHKLKPLSKVLCLVSYISTLTKLLEGKFQQHKRVRYGRGTGKWVSRTQSPSELVRDYVYVFRHTGCFRNPKTGRAQ